MVLTAMMDLLTMTIPNRISLLLIAAFFAIAPYAGLSLEEMMWHVASGASMLGIAFFMFSRGWVGGGDAKIFAAIALWLGFDQLGMFAAYAAMVGGVLTIGLLILRRIPLPMMLLKMEWLARLHSKGTGVPYGIALAFAALVMYPATPFGLVIAN